MSNGRQGELLFAQTMRQGGYNVNDVSGNPEYWYKDIDFIITSPTTGQVKAFEVKWDSRIAQTGNLYLELTNVNSKGGKGWFEFTEADYIAYGDAASKLFYIIPLLELKQRISKLPQRIVNCGYDSTGLLVRLSDIADIAKVI